MSRVGGRESLIAQWIRSLGDSKYLLQVASFKKGYQRKEVVVREGHPLSRGKDSCGALTVLFRGPVGKDYRRVWGDHPSANGKPA